MSIVSLVTADYFFKVYSNITNRCDDSQLSLENLCFHAEQFAIIKKLVNKFLIKHPRFIVNCSESLLPHNSSRRAAINCASNDGSEGWLVFLIGPHTEQFSVNMSIQDKPDDLGSVGKDATVFEGISCWKDAKTTPPICKGSGALASYSLKWENSTPFSNSPVCTETTVESTPSGYTELGRLCNDRLSLFNELLQKTPRIQNAPTSPPTPPPIPPSSPITGGAGMKMGVGIAVAICFAYKTVQEIRKFYSEENRKTRESSGQEREKTKTLAENNQLQRSGTNQKPSHQLTIAYAVGAAAALLFSAYTYFSEIA